MSPVFIFKNTLTNESCFVDTHDSDGALRICVGEKGWNPNYILYLGRSLDAPQKVRDPAAEGAG